MKKIEPQTKHPITIGIPICLILSNKKERIPYFSKDDLKKYPARKNNTVMGKPSRKTTKIVKNRLLCSSSTYQYCGANSIKVMEAWKMMTNSIIKKRNASKPISL
jgi:hypothetical protein